MADLRAALAPFAGSRETLLTFDERNRDIRGAFAPAVADRLAEVAATYDPDGRFVANHVAG